MQRNPFAFVSQFFSSNGPQAGVVGNSSVNSQYHNRSSAATVNTRNLGVFGQNFPYTSYALGNTNNPGAALQPHPSSHYSHYGGQQQQQQPNGYSQNITGQLPYGYNSEQNTNYFSAQQNSYLLASQIPSSLHYNQQFPYHNQSQIYHKSSASYPYNQVQQQQNQQLQNYYSGIARPLISQSQYYQPILNDPNYSRRMAVVTELEQHENKIVTEFVQLIDNSKQLFNGLRDLPQHGHRQWQTYFGRTFDVYTKLWKFQQQHRQILDTKYGLRRWQIGEIASKIGQLYYHY